MIYIDLIDGKIAIDWDRYDRLKNIFPCPSQDFRFTHQAIDSLDGTTDEKLQQLEKLLDNSVVYDFAHKEGKYCCRAQWQDRYGYGVADSAQEAKSLAQVDLLSILCDFPVDAYRENQVWEEFNNWVE